MDPLTSAAFDAIEAGGGIEDKNEPPVGTLGELTVVAGKLGVKENGDEYAVFEYRDRHYFWSDFKWIKKNGSISEGGVKSLKILLAQLGVPNVTGSTLQQAVTSRTGKRFAYERTQSGHNPTTNQPYTNTNILGEVPQGAGQSPVQAPPQAAPPVGATFDTGGFPQAQQPAWDQPATPPAVTPPASANVGG